MNCRYYLPWKWKVWQESLEESTTKDEGRSRKVPSYKRDANSCTFFRGNLVQKNKDEGVKSPVIQRIKKVERRLWRHEYVAFRIEFESGDADNDYNVNEQYGF